MVAKLNGQGFSEEQRPFEGPESTTTSAKTRANARDLFNLTLRDEAEIRVLRLQHEAHAAVYGLWIRRHGEGLSKKDLADRLERDPAWVSRVLAGPKNWTMRTLGEMARALDADIEIRLTANEDAIASEQTGQADGET